MVQGGQCIEFNKEAVWKDGLKYDLGGLIDYYSE